MRGAALPLLLCLACAAPAPRFVVDPTIPDVALSIPSRGEIRLNLPELARMPPDLASFLLLHEQGHLALDQRPDTSKARHRRMELAADCWASQRATAPERRVAVLFFQSLGPWSDGWHPTGLQRAAEIRRCAA